MKIDISMTATLRPDILYRTLQSFSEKLFKDKHQYRLVINVDPAGSETVEVFEVLEVCREHFKEVFMNVPAKAHFGKAFVWCWETVETDLVFHLEEDWELLQEVDIDHMISLFKKYPDLAHLRLNMFKSIKGVTKNWTHHHYHNGDYYPVTDELRGTLGWCGHPGFTTLKFIKHVLPHLNPLHNPEKQIKWRNKPLHEIIYQYIYGVYSPVNSGPVIRDIGRQWMVQNGYVKDGGKNKAVFTTWRKQ